MIVGQHGSYRFVEGISIPILSRWKKFLLKFKKSILIFERVSEHTENVYVYKWLFGCIHLVDAYGVTNFEAEITWNT